MKAGRIRVMTQQVLIVGGGIGGLAGALACSRAGWDVELFERASAFSEVGAGVQIGPNVVGLLHEWGLKEALERVAAYPGRLQVRDASSGRELGVLTLGERALQKYGAPYATIHRADLLQLLLDAVRTQTSSHLHLGQSLTRCDDDGHRVALTTTEGVTAQGDVLVGADGLWSKVREWLLADGPPRVPGHLAYRAMVLQSSLPAHLRSQQVTAWLGPGMHVVEYPVRAGEWLNVVAVVEGRVEGDPRNWNHEVHLTDVHQALERACVPLRDLIHSVPEWRFWVLCDRPPIQDASQQARGRVALLGDAAHPMRPYLAQGAGMAIEDAQALGQALRLGSLSLEERLRRYADNRWQRCARVQTQSIRNGVVFHSRGPLRWGRDASLRLLGERILDVPWLYRGQENTLGLLK